METKKLAAFLETAKTNSINKVAESLGYTQSGLTYTLNSLENELGIKLLSRNHSGVTLTPEGKELLPIIECVVMTMNSFETQVERIKKRNQDIIHVGAYNSVMINWLPRAIDGFTKKYPDAQFEISTGIKSLKQLIEEEALDVIICEEHIPSNNYHWEKILDDEMCVVVRTDSPLAKQEFITFDMLKEQHVIYPSVNTNGIVPRTLRAEGIKFNKQTNIITEDGSVTLSMISRSGGVSFVSRMYEPECPENVKMISMSVKIVRELGVAIHKNSLQSKTLKRFVQQLKTSAKK